MKRKLFVFVLMLFFFLLAAGFLSYSYFLPPYIEKTIIAGLGDHISSSVTGNVYGIGFTKGTLGNIVVGAPQTPAVSIGSIQSVYSPTSLLAKKVESIKINGLTLNLLFSDGKFLVPGIDLEKLTRAKTEEKEADPTTSINLPLQLESLQVSNGLLNIQYQERHILIPFALDISRQVQMAPDGFPVYLLNMQIAPQGAIITITGILDTKNNTGNISLAADSLDLNSFAFLLGDMQKSLHFGSGTVSGNTAFKIMPFQLSSAEIDVELQSVHLSNVPVTIGTSPENTEKISPVRLKVKGQGKQWEVEAQGAIAEPVTGLIALKGSLMHDDETLSSSGNLVFRLNDILPASDRDQKNLIIKNVPELIGDFSFDITSSGTWQAKLASNGIAESKRKSKPFQIQYGHNILQANTPVIVIQGKGSAESHEMNASLDLPAFNVTRGDETELITPKARFQAAFNLDNKSGMGNLGSGTFNCSLSGSKYKMEGLSGKGDITIQGSMKPQMFQNIASLQAKGKFAVENAFLEHQDSRFTVSAIDGHLPWRWPFSGEELTGKIKVGQISWKDNELGSFDAAISLKEAVYTVNGRQISSLLNGMVTNVSGKAGIVDSGFQADLTLHSDRTSFSSLHLGRFDPALNNSYLTGELGLDGSFRVDANGLQGYMAVNMQNGRYEYPEKKYEVSGIAFALQLPYLPDLRSTPAQKILFEKASLGNLLFEKGKIIWQLESVNSLFIEEGVVRWSGGRVFTNAVRISPDMQELVVTIFCDRLILADILRQFGIPNAEGEGTVSGRIPLWASKGTIRFEDGFLYSSPGQGGSVKVAAFDLLSAGIPKNTPHFAQVDFAAEALKNFKYNWVKLLLNSEGENLIMQMQMDGKPLQALPFTYDSQTGMLQRVEDSPMGIDQPIRLDVNFSLPLNRFLGYSGRIQDIMKKIK